MSPTYPATSPRNTRLDVEVSLGLHDIAKVDQLAHVDLAPHFSSCFRAPSTSSVCYSSRGCVSPKRRPCRLTNPTRFTSSTLESGWSRTLNSHGVEWGLLGFPLSAAMMLKIAQRSTRVLNAWNSYAAFRMEGMGGRVEGNSIISYTYSSSTLDVVGTYWCKGAWSCPGMGDSICYELICIRY